MNKGIEQSQDSVIQKAATTQQVLGNPPREAELAKQEAAATKIQALARGVAVRNEQAKAAAEIARQEAAAEAFLQKQQKALLDEVQEIGKLGLVTQKINELNKQQESAKLIQESLEAQKRQHLNSNLPNVKPLPKQFTLAIDEHGKQKNIEIDGIKYPLYNFKDQSGQVHEIYINNANLPTKTIDNKVMPSIAKAWNQNQQNQKGGGR